ncbi:MAG: indole-3-glycerol phosphate synthase TrpC [Deltaproteobacteria bacterium]|nr:indole-3-glycerol phosphate synthase TrpC [Deltaproteobacteria bacterium]MCZ6563080.1 indole-3-glycerol phosphate synthase TrpC [Deltaproteobacteria bacterium]
MFLDEIAGHVRKEIVRRQLEAPPSLLKDRPLFHLPPRGFERSLQGDSRCIIAEVKRASPSRGLIREEFDAVKIAKQFAANGACALSVLTEERFFQGSLLYLEQIKMEVPLPVLRKDFIVDGYQLLEARSFGADAVLFIMALLDLTLLRELLEQARSLCLDSLVEVHTEEELTCALKAGACLIGINNRNLRTFEVNLETTERLMPMLPRGIMVVCESGIECLDQISRLEGLGVHNFLVGEALMSARDPGAKLRELLAKE